MRRHLVLSPSHRGKITAGHCIPTISSLGKTRTRLVLLVVLDQPAHVSQDCTTRPHGSHGSLERRRNKVEDLRSAPPHCRTSRFGKINEGMGPSSPNNLVSHPGDERHQQKLDYDLAVIKLSPFAECTERKIPPSRFRPNIHRGKSLLTKFLLPSPPSRTHPGNTRS